MYNTNITSNHISQISTIFYINNIPTTSIQKIITDLKLKYNCKISYFNNKQSFLQVDWISLNLTENSFQSIQRDCLLKLDNLKNAFLIPVAVMLNEQLISLRDFSSMVGNEEVFSLNTLFKDLNLVNNATNLNFLSDCTSFTIIENIKSDNTVLFY